MEINRLSDITKKREKYISDALAQMDSRLSSMESDLYSYSFADIAGGLEFDSDHNLLFSEKNIYLLSRVDDTMKNFRDTSIIPFLLWMALSIKRQEALVKEYFSMFSNTIKIDSKLTTSLLGVDPAITKLLDGGYLNNLSFPSQVMTGIKDFLLRAFATGMGWDDFMKGFKLTIEGQGENVGILRQYYDTYAGDLWNQHQRIIDNMAAEQLGLKHFLYAGTIIPTSRKFCIERAGRVFTIEDTKDWKCDPNLPGNHGGCDETYQPLIELGRWNCRHSIAWVDEAAAEVLSKE